MIASMACASCLNTSACCMPPRREAVIFIELSTALAGYLPRWQRLCLCFGSALGLGAGFALARLRLVITAGQRVPADLQGVQPHVKAIAPGMEFRSLIMSPGHRHFGHLQFHVMGQVNDLGVKAPALNALQGKDHRSGAARESLEPALGIAIGESQQRAYEEVISARHELAFQ